MGTKVRIVGADAVLRGISEVSYGIAPTSGYKLLSYHDTALDSERLLGYDPLLGQGRDAADPFYQAVNVNGDVGIPLDVQNLGFWLNGIFGTDTPTAKAATGTFTFSANPVNTGSITLNAVAWTFTTAASGATNTHIEATLRETLQHLVAELNASVNATVDDNVYTADDTHLYLTNKVGGVAGNSYTLAADGNSFATVSAATLTGGSASTLQHTFTSGAALPSKTLEVGHAQLVTTQFFRYTGCKFGTLAFDLARTGPANAKVNVIAQKRTDAAVTIDGSATPYVLSRFSQGSGGVFLNNFQVANITGGNVAYSNQLEAIETIRSDALIDGVDENEARCTGSATVRAGTDATLLNAVLAQTPVKMEYSFSLPIAGPSAYVFRITLPRVFLPKPKATISGPGGVEMVFDWQASKDATAGYLARVILVNDLTAAYA